MVRIKLAAPNVRACSQNRYRWNLSTSLGYWHQAIHSLIHTHLPHTKAKNPNQPTKVKIPKSTKFKKNKFLLIGFQDSRGAWLLFPNNSMAIIPRRSPLIPRNNRYTPLIVFEITSEVIWHNIIYFFHFTWQNYRLLRWVIYPSSIPSDPHE